MVIDKAIDKPMRRQSRIIGRMALGNDKLIGLEDKLIGLVGVNDIFRGRGRCSQNQIGRPTGHVKAFFLFSGDKKPIDLCNCTIKSNKQVIEYQAHCIDNQFLFDIMLIIGICVL